MAIELQRMLKRNKISLKSFIQKNKLTSYEHLLEYCKYRNFTPPDEEAFKQNIEVTKEKDEKQKVDRVEKGTNRKTSEAQKKRKARNSSKRKQAAPKLPNSNV